MKSILSFLSGAFKNKPKQEVVVLTQATKIEAAHQSLTILGEEKFDKLDHRKADGIRISAIAEDLVQFNAILVSYVSTFLQEENLSTANLLGRATEITFAKFLIDEDNFYISKEEIERFYKLSRWLVDHLYKYKDEQSGKGYYHIRILGNCFVSIKNISDALITCRTK